MTRPLDGIRVIEVASWMFVPSAGAVLVDQGAEVLKVEHPETGDPQRGLVTSGLLPGGADGVNFMMEQPNHGKRSVAIDISTPDGREALLTLVETADVFLTNQLPQVRRKLGIDTDDIRARNPRIIVARGSGQGTRGPDAEKAGYDDEDHAVRIANDSTYGLSGMITSGDLERAKAVARRIRTGTLGINSGIWYGADAPFGGYKQSGIGRQCGVEGLEIFTETKTVGWPQG